MGCASSKQSKRCRHCRRGISPVMVPRSYSMHIHHPAAPIGDGCHVLSLSSSNFGSVRFCDTPLGRTHMEIDDFTAAKLLSDNNKDNLFVDNNGSHRETDKDKTNSDLQTKLMEAKVWSSMMNEKIPKMAPRTPIMTPPGEPEMINTWELMEGLEDASPLLSPTQSRSFSFNVVAHSPPMSDLASFDRPKSRFQVNTTSEPLVFQMEDDEHSPAHRFEDFDPEIISSFRKSLQELPPDHPFHIRIPDMDKNPNLEFSDDLDEEEDEAGGISAEPISRRQALGKDKVILYFTSLRGIRKTYEDCCHARIILKGLGIRVDERDISMHSGFKDELKELLGDNKFDSSVGITLPRVFLGRKYLGGADEIRKLNEDGKLEKLLEGCDKVKDSGCLTGNECQACGDVRFVPCDTCSGSCKVYHECDDDDDDDGHGKEDKEETEYGFQRCPDCNENGLIRCPMCCD